MNLTGPVECACTSCLVKNKTTLPMELLSPQKLKPHSKATPRQGVGKAGGLGSFLRKSLGPSEPILLDPLHKEVRDPKAQEEVPRPLLLLEKRPKFRWGGVVGVPILREPVGLFQRETKGHHPFFVVPLC